MIVSLTQILGVSCARSCFAMECISTKDLSSRNIRSNADLNVAQSTKILDFTINNPSAVRYYLSNHYGKSDSEDRKNLFTSFLQDLFEGYSHGFDLQEEGAHDQDDIMVCIKNFSEEQGIDWETFSLAVLQNYIPWERNVKRHRTYTLTTCMNRSQRKTDKLKLKSAIYEAFNRPHGVSKEEVNKKKMPLNDLVL